MTNTKQMGHLWLMGTSLACVMLMAACGQSSKSNDSTKAVVTDAATIGASNNAVCAPTTASTKTATGSGTGAAANASGSGALTSRTSLSGRRSALGPSSLDLVDAGVSYAGNIQALMKTSCLGCHAAGAVQPDLSTAALVTANQAGIAAAVAGATMPPPPATLTAANKALFKSWEDGGFQMTGGAAPASPGILGSGTGGAATSSNASGSSVAAAASVGGSSACPAPATPAVSTPAPSSSPTTTASNASGSSAAPAATIPNPLAALGGGTGGFDISAILAQLAAGGTAGLPPDVLKQITALLGQAGAAIPAK